MSVAVCDDGVAAVLSGVGDEGGQGLMSSKSAAVSRSRLRSSSSVTSPLSPQSSDELGTYISAPREIALMLSFHSMQCTQRKAVAYFSDATDMAGNWHGWQQARLHPAWLQTCDVCLTCRPDDVCVHLWHTRWMFVSRCVQLLATKPLLLLVLGCGTVYHQTLSHVTQYHGFVVNSSK